jgi:catechol 2,3-dioxygenase-like lactoylglutathione lyase family enzyme
MPRVAIAAADFEGLVDTCRNRLGLPVIDLSDQTVPALGANLAMCVPPGGSNIELMSPAIADAPLAQSLQRFLDRRGQGLFALMLEAPDPNAEAQGLAARGLKVLPLMAGAGGRDVHPASAHGVLIRVYPVDSYVGQPPPDAPPAATSGIVRVIIAVRDASEARTTYGERLGLAAGTPVHDAARGVTSVQVRPPRGGTIELVEVRDASRPFAAAVAAHLAASGEGLFALVLQATDPAGLADGLRARGLDARPASDAAGMIEIARDTMFGARILVEPRPQTAIA